MLAVFAMMSLVVGAAIEKGLFSQEAAAWAQAVLSVLAVAAAAWLQDRSLSERDRLAYVRRLEGASSVALWAYKTFEEVLGRASYDGMDPQAFLGVFREAEFEAAVRALRTVPVSELGDADLTTALLRLETAMQHAANELFGATEQARRNPAAVPANMLVKKFEVDIHNAAAAAEGRAAQLIGRKPAM